MTGIWRNYVLLSSVVLLSVLFSIKTVHAAPKGAVCLVRADNSLVMVKEILTEKWSLPAGTIAVDEPPQQAAQREVWEETGLVVTVGKELGHSESAVFFDCVADSDLIAFGQQDKDGGHVLPIWFAPHYGIEIAHAHLIDPFSIEADVYRYPAEWQFIQDLYLKATEQPVSYVESLAEAAPSFHQLELPWIAKFQSWLRFSDSPPLTLISSLLLGGLMLSSPWWLLLLPICYSQLGRDFTFKLIFTLIFGALVVQLGKVGFELPRPFVYQPSLNLAQQVGYGLPSLSVTLWTIGFATVGNQLGLKGWNRFSLINTVVLLWLVVALFYSASTFLIDSLTGLLFGWLCAWHMSRLDTKIGEKSQQLFVGKGVWLMLSVLSGIFAFLWQTPQLLGLALVSCAFLLSVFAFELPKLSALRLE